MKSIASLTRTGETAPGGVGGRAVPGLSPRRGDPAKVTAAPPRDETASSSFTSAPRARAAGRRMRRPRGDSRNLYAAIFGCATPREGAEGLRAEASRRWRPSSGRRKIQAR